MALQGEVVPTGPAQKPEAEQAQPFRDLLSTLCGKLRQGVSPEEDLPQQMQQATQDMSGTELRDHLLSIDPLDNLWVARVNEVFHLQSYSRILCCDPVQRSFSKLLSCAMMQQH